MDVFRPRFTGTMLAAAATAAEYSRILPANAPRLLDHNVVSECHLNTLGVNLVLNSVEDLLECGALTEYAEVMKEGKPLDQDAIDRIMKHISLPKLWQATVTATVSTTTYTLLLHLLEDAAGPHAVPSTTAGQLLLHGTCMRTVVHSVCWYLHDPRCMQIFRAKPRTCK